MPRVKICGITSTLDAKAAVDAGADALGVVFYAQSSRCVSISQAREISQVVGPFVTLVGLFVNATVAEVNSVLASVPIHVLQFHGDEDAAFCEQFQRPYLKAIRMRPELDLDAAIAAHPNAGGILLDAYRKGVPGGTGESFDWRRVPVPSSQAIVLAGGLNPDNIQKALAACDVWGVDVSGGVESAPGQKDHGAIKQFIERVRQ